MDGKVVGKAVWTHGGVEYASLVTATPRVYYHFNSGLLPLGVWWGLLHPLTGLLHGRFGHGILRYAPKHPFHSLTTPQPEVTGRRPVVRDTPYEICCPGSGGAS